MPFDQEKVTPEFEEFAFHGKPGPDGDPVGLTDEEYDELVARYERFDEIPPWKENTDE